MQRLLLVSVLVLGWTASFTAAQDPEKKETRLEVLPPPRLVNAPVSSQVMPYYIPSSVPQPRTREVWQYYGVDSRGRWLPRVILTPAGAQYYYNGAPFPYTTTQPHLYMPYVLD